MNKHLISSDRTLTTHQRNNPTQVCLFEPKFLLGVTYNCMGEELLSDYYVTIKLISVRGMIHKCCILELLV